MSDRRAPGSTQLLMVPSGFRAWPILYKRIDSLEPRLVRLRSGKPVFVFTNAQVNLLITVASKFPGRHTLNPMSGFEATPRKPWKRLFIVLISSLLVACVVMPFRSTTKNISEDSKKGSACSAIPFGAELTKAQFQSRSFERHGERFKISVSEQNGGLYLVRLYRECDGKVFQGKAWLEKKGLLITDRN